MNEFEGKKITIAGLARSGAHSVKILAGRGALVTVSDIKPAKDLSEFTEMLSGVNYKLEAGGHTEESFLGADLLVVSPGVPLNTPLFEKVRAKGIPVIGEIELAYSLLKGTFIGITGTKGKTTTTTLAGLILSRGSTKVRTAGNIGNPLASLVDGEPDMLYVLELSSFQLETIKTFKPYIAAITNVSEDHMDRYKSLQEYIEAKAMIFRNQTRNEYLILNANDKYTPLYTSMAASNIIYFSSKTELEEGAFLKDGYITVRFRGGEYRIIKASELLIKGMHNVENAMIASLIGVLMRVTPSVIGEVLAKFEGVEHRQEFVAEVNGVKFINNSQGTNIDAVEKSFLSYANPVIAIMGGRNKGSDFAKLAGTVKEKVKKIVLIGEAKKEIRAALAGSTKLADAATMEEAIRKAYKSAEPGDVVMLSPACASFDMFKDYRDRGIVFKEAVLKLRKEEASVWN